MVSIEGALASTAGVSASNLNTVKDLGFAGAAVLGSVWQATDPVAAVDELLSAAALIT